MEKYLDRLSKELKGLIKLAGDIASENNMSAYLVGGFVRDLILRVKNFDLDIVVEGDGIKFAEDFCSHLKARLITHRRFGTATIIIRPGLKVDIATARKEVYPEPASLPAVKFATLKDDLQRRDFTINAMAVSINHQDRGALIDFFDGIGDLRNKKIRVLHTLSFIDDPTRILRAVRFEKRFNFKIEARTLRLIKEASGIDMLNKIQPQRLRDELILILEERQPLKYLKRVEELAGFTFLSPRLLRSKIDYNLLRAIEKQIRWFQMHYRQRRALDGWLIYFIGLLDKLAKKDAQHICHRLALKKGETKRVMAYKNANRQFIRRLSKRSAGPSEIFGLLESLSYEVIVLLKAKFKNRQFTKHIKDFLEVYNGVRLYITGDDLNRLGVRPGPCYRRIFNKTLKAKLDGTIKTKKDELSFVKSIVKVK